MLKYKNKITTVDNIRFDSRKEADRYIELKLLEKADKIKNIRLQVSFELLPKQNDERAVKYIADFVYHDNIRGVDIVEDVKGYKTREYVLKRKLFKWRYGDKYVFEEY